MLSDNSENKLKQFIAITELNSFACVVSFENMTSFMKHIVLEHHSKMTELKENITIYLTLVELFGFKLLFLSNFGNNVFWLPAMLLIALRQLLSGERHHLKFSITVHLLYPICAFLGACAMFTINITSEISLLLEAKSLFLGYPFGKKG